MSADTPPEVERLYRELIMSRSPSERLSMGAAMFTSARLLSLAGLHAEGCTDFRVGLFLRFYGHEYEPAERATIVERLRVVDREQPLDWRTGRACGASE